MTIQSFTGEWRPLSNFWYVSVANEDDGIIYPTVEHAFQAAKTWDLDIRRQIQKASSPQAAKAIGRSPEVRVTMMLDWEARKRLVMLGLLKQKFIRTTPALTDLLLSTENHTLIEGNTWHDNYWGMCSCAACEHDRRVEFLIGQNWLGKLLMHVRLELQLGAK